VRRYSKALGFCIIPLLEVAGADDTDNPTEDAARAKAASLWFKLPLWLWLPVQTATIIAVRWCMLTVSTPVLRAPLVSALESYNMCTAFKHCFQFQLAPLHRGRVGVLHTGPVAAPGHRPGAVRGRVLWHRHHCGRA
jgi:hypothetical protein